MSDTDTYLAISWSLSRGRDTYGYNIARLRDTVTGKAYRCMGGGYDMTGTVFGEWLENTHQDALRAIADQAGARYVGSERIRNDAAGALYGMVELSDGRISLDGACGLSSMYRVARAIGLELRQTVSTRGNLTGIVVTASA